MEGFLDSALALLIGLLLGLEREHSEAAEERFAGIRTFPLLALAGYVGALVGREGPTLLLPAVMLGLAGLVVAAYHWTAATHHGVTSEALALLAPLLGALCAHGRGPLAASLAVIVTLLLAMKTPLHRFVGALSEDELLSFLKFGIVAVVALPLLPTEPMGPYDAVVPRHVGVVVVIICARSASSGTSSCACSAAAQGGLSPGSWAAS